MTKPFILDPQDRALFRQAVGPVEPLRCDRIEPTRFHPAPIPRFTEADERQALADTLSNCFEPAELDTGEELYYRQEKGAARRCCASFDAVSFRLERRSIFTG